MENKLEKIMELSREPMLLLENGMLRHLNTAARLLFHGVLPGDTLTGIIPDNILHETAESFLSALTFRGNSYTVSALRDGETLLLSLSPEPSAAEVRGCLSDSTMSGMLSALFNLKLASDRISAQLEQPAADVRKYQAILTHNYYLLNHRLTNLDFLCAIREHNMPILPRHTDLTALCSNIVTAVNDALNSKHPKIEFICDANPILGSADASKLERLILNLLSNSLKNTPADGHIRLRLSRSGSGAVLSVDDTGSGFSPETLSNVFCGYRNRIDEKSLSSSGTGGLGLAICRYIAEAHGGTIIIESRVGEGTSVRVLLPMEPPKADLLLTGPPLSEDICQNYLLTELADVLDFSEYAPDTAD